MKPEELAQAGVRLECSNGTAVKNDIHLGSVSSMLIGPQRRRSSSRRRGEAESGRDEGAGGGIRITEM